MNNREYFWKNVAVLGNGQLSPGMQLMTTPFAMEARGQKARNLIQQGS